MMKVGTPLQRGKACLNCRKRKMKCDGVRPACTQCIKANRDEECQFHDKKQVSRTEMLRAKVAKLEARLRELENEQSGSASSSPAPQSPGPSSSSSQGEILLMPPDFSRPSTSASTSEAGDFLRLSPASSSHHAASFFPHPHATAWLSDYLDVPLFLEDPYGTGSSGEFNFADYMEMRDNPYAVPFNQAEDLDNFCQGKQKLLDIFLAHRHQCAYDVHTGRFRASLSAPPPQQPHPALLDAMYLMGCHFSQLPQHTAQEPHFLQSALAGISAALQHNDRLVQVVQASCLIAVYFFGRGRVLEGYYHSSTAARLAVSLGLHQIKSEDWYQLQMDVGSAVAVSQPAFVTFKCSLQLPAPRDMVEYAERVAAFWQVFLVDRAWSVASGLPAALPDDDSPRAVIETALPMAINDASPMMNSIDPMSQFDSSKQLPSLRAKAVSLFEQTYRLSSKSFQSQEQFRTEHRTLDLSLSQFNANVPPLSSDAFVYQDHLTSTDIELVFIHTLIHASTIHLHRDFMEVNVASYQRSLLAAQFITNMIGDFSDADYDYLNPIISTCWKCAAHIYLRVLSRSQMVINKPLVAGVQQHLNTLVNAMRSLGRIFSASAQDATKIETDTALARSALYSHNNPLT